MLSDRIPHASCSGLSAIEDCRRMSGRMPAGYARRKALPNLPIWNQGGALRAPRTRKRRAAQPPLRYGRARRRVAAHTLAALTATADST